MNKVKILLITNINHPNYSRMEKGFYESSTYAFGQLIKDFSFSQLSVELKWLDVKALHNFIDEVNNTLDHEVLFIVGCAQSGLTKLLLENVRLKHHLIFSPLSTATFLTDKNLVQNNFKNFFQTTSSDKIRMESLVKEVIRLYPRKKIYYYYPNDAVFSYPVGLKNDLENILASSYPEVASKGIELEIEPELDITSFPDSGSPVIICAGSRQAVKIARFLRKKRKRNQIFTFGSNSKLLDNSMIGSVVVCDLDRNSSNLFFNEHLADLFNIKDPSVSTLIAFNVIMQTIKDKEQEIVNHDNNIVLRQSLISYVNNKMFLVDNKQISFNENGLSTANDHILLRVSFGIFTPRFRGKINKKRFAPKFPKETRGFIGSAVSVLFFLIIRTEQAWSFLEKIYKAVFSFFG